MLEAMQEHRVTVAGRTYTLDAPFFVLATQNPIEQEGTYPLPEAQLDRFMFMIGVDYPVARRGTRHCPHAPPARRLPTARARARRREGASPSRIWCAACRCRITFMNSPSISRAARGPVAGIARLAEAAGELGRRPARGAISYPRREGARRAVTAATWCGMEDIIAVADPVLRHRVMTTFTAESEGVTSREWRSAWWRN